MRTQKGFVCVSYILIFTILEIKTEKLKIFNSLEINKSLPINRNNKCVKIIFSKIISKNDLVFQNNKKYYFNFLWISEIYGLIEDNWILESASVFTLWQYAILTEAYEKNLASHIYVTVIFWNYKYGTLWYYNKTWEGSFLKVSCNVKYATKTMNFSY